MEGFIFSFATKNKKCAQGKAPVCHQTRSIGHLQTPGDPAHPKQEATHYICPLTPAASPCRSLRMEGKGSAGGEEEGTVLGGGGGASGEVAFIRILPTWADFLRLTANHVRLCRVMYPAASRGHQRRVERRGGGPPSISRFSQPPSGEPLTPKHFDSWDGDIGSMFGLSLPCPDCHCSHVCVCV